MNLNSLAIFVDANEAVGMGHLYRMNELALEFNKKNINTIFITPSKIVLDFLKTNSKNKVILTSDYEQVNYKTEIINLLSDNKINIVVFDLLEKELKLHDFLEKTKVYIASIQSFIYKFERFENIIFFPDSQELSEKSIKSADRSIPFYSGPKYLILRDEFKNIKKEEPNADLFKIFVSTGSLDTFELLPFILSSIENIGTNIEIFVIMNKLARTKADVYKISKKSKNIINVLESVENISHYMALCDLAIINGGSTRYELAVIGTPFIAISIHQEQYNITERFTLDNTYSVNLGLKEKVLTYDLVKEIEKFYKNSNNLKIISKKMQKRFDTNGKSRIVDLILTTSKDYL